MSSTVCVCVCVCVCLVIVHPIWQALSFPKSASMYLTYSKCERKNLKMVSRYSIWSQ